MKIFFTFGKDKHKSIQREHVILCHYAMYCSKLFAKIYSYGKYCEKRRNCL